MGGGASRARPTTSADDLLEGSDRHVQGVGQPDDARAERRGLDAEGQAVEAAVERQGDLVDARSDVVEERRARQQLADDLAADHGAVDRAGRADR